MAKTTPNAFGLESSLDMLRKLERDYWRLAQSIERQDAIDHGLNVAMTAWHMIDWVWAEIKRSEARLAELGVRGKGKKAFAGFKDYVLNACPELRYCQIIATSAKHLGYEVKPQDPKFDTRAEPAGIKRVNNQGNPVYYDNDNGEPTRWTPNAWELCIFEGAIRRPASEVFFGALFWWRRFLRPDDFVGI
jgi:hypothetical protein